jgi:hypothetical protein
MKPSRRVTKMKRLALVLLLLAACSSDSDVEQIDPPPMGGRGFLDRPGNAAVYERIAAETDCAELQKEFDTAEANHDRDSGTGKTTAAEIDTSYMEVADARMRAVGCY